MGILRAVYARLRQDPFLGLIVGTLIAAAIWAGVTQLPSSLSSKAHSVPFFVEVRNVPPAATSRSGSITVLRPGHANAAFSTEDQSSTYVLPMLVTQIGAPPSGDSAEWSPWVHDRGGADAGTTDVEVSLQGNAPQAVVFRRVRVGVSQIRPPIQGTQIAQALSNEGACKKEPPVEPMEIPAVHLAIDLDQTPPTVTTTDSTYTEPQPFHQFSLSPSEATLLLIHARAARATYTWVLELDYITNGKEYHRVVNASDGRPFMTSPAAHNPLYRWFAVNKPYGWHRCRS